MCYSIWATLLPYKCIYDTLLLFTWVPQVSCIQVTYKVGFINLQSRYSKVIHLDIVVSRIPEVDFGQIIISICNENLNLLRYWISHGFKRYINFVLLFNSELVYLDFWKLLLFIVVTVLPSLLCMYCMIWRDQECQKCWQLYFRGWEKYCNY